ncbi:LytTR family DNA-binding domain-containing protein [Fulvivirgaceae bacterium BMA10]|uniref:LytTR family DNA-binding domain-containing protein n=1 Tax=Splendidivirga corallicola TaxID=3051826 RepID=A0ABT8KJS6_9BACT|nr:LytTR family DNA-binding domain-containing protein [Fulvivirgaceae bacterium BMA10]
MPQLFRAIIVEDEILARKRLIRLLNEYEREIEVVGEATNGQEGLELIEKLDPDLVFLDIEMPGLNGFEMLQKLDNPPTVIFTTAYEEYAIKAFQENSIDYLLKPIEEERLKTSLDKLKKFNNRTSSENIDSVLSLIEQLKPKPDLVSFPVKVGDRIIMVKLEDIVYFEAADKYVNLYTNANQTFLIDQSLSELVIKLPENFLRVHRGNIVNKNYIKEFQKHFNNRFILVLEDGTRIRSGKSYYEELKALLTI